MFRLHQGRDRIDCGAAGGNCADMHKSGSCVLPQGRIRLVRLLGQLVQSVTLRFVFGCGLCQSCFCCRARVCGSLRMQIREVCPQGGIIGGFRLCLIRFGRGQPFIQGIQHHGILTDDVLVARLILRGAGFLPGLQGAGGFLFRISDHTENCAVGLCRSSFREHLLLLHHRVIEVTEVSDFRCRDACHQADAQLVIAGGQTTDSRLVHSGQRHSRGLPAGKGGNIRQFLLVFLLGNHRKLVQVDAGFAAGSRHENASVVLAEGGALRFCGIGDVSASDDKRLAGDRIGCRAVANIKDILAGDNPGDLRIVRMPDSLRQRSVGGDVLLGQQSEFILAEVSTLGRFRADCVIAAAGDLGIVQLQGAVVQRLVPG